MIQPVRSTPEVPHRSVPLPAPLGPRDRVEIGGLRVPDPTAGYRPFRPPDVPWTRLAPTDPRWTEGVPSDQGKARTEGLRSDQGATRAEGIRSDKGTTLADGSVRFGGPHDGRLEGLTVDGLPVTYHWKGHNYFWMLALDDVVDDLLLAGDEADRKVGKGTVTAPNGVHVPYVQRVAQDGTQRLVMTLPGEKELRVTSRQPLDPRAVETLCAGFAECPPVALKGLQDVYVVDSLGEKIDDEQKGPAHPLSAITRAGVPDITFVHARLCDPELGRHVVLHEVGHLVDGIDRVGCVSATQTDGEGPLFGGEITDSEKHFDLRQDAYASHYASLSPKEDFAEIHAVVMRQRTAFSLANPGHDLLTEPPEVASAYLSPRLGLKAEAVVERYRELGHEAPRPTWAERVRQALGLG